LCGRQTAPEGLFVDVVGEDLLALDLDDWDQLPVGRLELGIAVDRNLLELEVKLLPERADLCERPFAKVTAVRVVNDDARFRDIAHA
jgi:hypothetical protein